MDLLEGRLPGDYGRRARRRIGEVPGLDADVGGVARDGPAVINDEPRRPGEPPVVSDLLVEDVGHRTKGGLL